MSLLKADTIKPVTSGTDLSLQGDSGGSAVDCLNITSAGDINFSGNTDAKIKLPSAGGIYESDGSTAILTESGGTVTMQNVTAGSGLSGFAGVSFSALLLDVKSQNTDGGTLNLGDWRDRDLNTEVFDVDSVVSVSSDQFTLIAGTYIIEFGCPTMGVSRTQSRLYNVTTTAAVAYGTSVYVSSVPTAQWSVGWLRVVLSGSTVYKLQTRVEVSLSTTGGGQSANFSSEHYSYVKIQS
tara:strand:+ start:1815 stop:2528 length:714 start_codon:yes stop_codon:yes gene_type:complete